MTKGVVTEPRRSSRQKALKVKEESKPITLHEYDSDGSSDLSSVPDDFEGRGVGITLKAEEPNPTVPSSALDSQHHGWNHPSELEYLTPSDWSDTQIMHHLIAHSFDIPSQKPHGGTPFVEFTSVDGSTTVLPSGYRVPLMLFMRFQWDTLKLVLSSSNSVTTREAQWNLYKYPLLHISRLCKTLLQQAQDSLGGFDVDLDSGVTKRKPKQEGINKWWRCDTFDRALVRYKMKWVIVEGDKAKFEAKVKEFWEKYGEKEFKRDVLKCSWRKSALAGHHGFALTENEIQNGITAKELMDGLKEKDGKWCWETSPNANGGTDAWTLRKTASKSSRFAAPAPSTLTSMTSTVVNQQLGSISSLGHTPTSSASRKRHGCSLEREGVAKKARKVTATSSKKLVEPVAQPFPSTCPPLQVKVVGERDIVEPHSDILEIEIGNKPDSLRSRSDAAASRPLATSARSAPSCRQPNVRLLRREDFILPEARDLQEKTATKSSNPSSGHPKVLPYSIRSIPNQAKPLTHSNAAIPNHVKSAATSNSRSSTFNQQPRSSAPSSPSKPPIRSQSQSSPAVELSEVKERLHRVESLMIQHQNESAGILERLSESILGLRRDHDLARVTLVYEALDRVEKQVLEMREELRRGAGKVYNDSTTTDTRREAEIETDSDSTLTPGLRLSPYPHPPPHDTLVLPAQLPLPLDGFSLLHPLAHLLAEPADIASGNTGAPAVGDSRIEENTFAASPPGPDIPGLDAGLDTELLEQKYQIPAPKGASSPSPSDGIKDLKLVIIHGEAYLRSAKEDKEMIPVSVFSGPAKRQRKFMKLGLVPSGLDA